MKISARLREQAALYLDCVASSNYTWDALFEINGQFAATARALANSAYRALYVDTDYDDHDGRELGAEAAQRLREGWEP